MMFCMAFVMLLPLAEQPCTSKNRFGYSQYYVAGLGLRRGAVLKRIPALCILLLFCMIPVPLGEGTPNVRISGQVRGEDNQPIANCWVGAYDGNQKSLGVSTRTDTKGWYELLVPVLDSYIVDICPAGSLKSGVYAFDYFGLAKKVWRQDATSVTVDIILHQVGNLVLKAFDVGGNLMRAKDFGWWRNIYATDENGIRVVDDRFYMPFDTFSSAKNRDVDLRLPAVMVLLNHRSYVNPRLEACQRHASSHLSINSRLEILVFRSRLRLEC